MSCESEPPTGEPLAANLDVTIIGATAASPMPLVPPAVSPNVSSVVPPIRPISSSLFVDADPFAVDDAANALKSSDHVAQVNHVDQVNHIDHVGQVNHVDQVNQAVVDTHDTREVHVDTHTARDAREAHVEAHDTHEATVEALPQDHAVSVSVDATAPAEGNTVDAHHEPQQFNQPIEDPAYPHQDQHQLQQHQQQSQEPMHSAAFNDTTHSDLQATVVSMTTAMPTVSQEMGQIPVSLSGTGVDAPVPMVTVASESVGIPSVTVSAAMSTDIYTSTAGSVVVSGAQLTNAHNPNAFSGMEYMANPTDQPQHPEHSTAENPDVGQNFGVEVAPKFQDEVVNVVAALPDSEGVHPPIQPVQPVPIVTSAQAPIVVPNTAVNVAAMEGQVAAPPEIPYGGETVDKCVECEVCGSLFGDAGSLRRHAARAHRAATGKGPVFCPQCSAQLKNEQNLRRHIAVCHSGSQENRCNMCSASFGSRGSLRIHQQSVHAVPSASKGRSKGVTKPKAEKSFLCDMCTDTFKWKGNLKRHRKLRHLQERPFQCKICHATFGTKSNMGVHYITHQNSSVLPTPAVAPVPQVVANPEVPE